MVAASENTAYKPILADPDYQDAERWPERRPFLATRAAKLATAFNVLLFIASLVSVLVSLNLSRQKFVLNADLRRASSYSPILDRLDLGMKVRKVNGTLFPAEDPSIARQLPNDEADRLWGEWEITRIVPVTREQIARMGKDPATVVRLDDDVWHLGDDAYAAIFDVYHQLHCLNGLRRRAYGDYYHKGPARAEKAGLDEIHLNHCVDILMQALQCSGNVNLMTMHYVETQPYPVPDMSVNRQCIDFDRLTDWRRQNSIDLATYDDTMALQGREGIVVLPMTDKYWPFFPDETPGSVKTSGEPIL